MLIVVRNSDKSNENRILGQRISNCRTQLFCGLICHALDQKIEGSNLAATKNLFKFKSTTSDNLGRTNTKP